jgi:hypothetical protein
MRGTATDSFGHDAISIGAIELPVFGCDKYNGLLLTFW